MIFQRCCVYNTQFLQMNELGTTEWFLWYLQLYVQEHHINSVVFLESDFPIPRYTHTHAHTLWPDYRETIIALPLYEMMRFSFRKSKTLTLDVEAQLPEGRQTTQRDIKKGKNICLSMIQREDLHHDEQRSLQFYYRFFFPLSLH